jgi:prepilin-type processing-associated H-X9-DG protein
VFPYGLYPVYRWPSGVPAQIGYIFESAEFGVDQNHFRTAYDRNDNSWGVGSWGGTYCPVAPHQNYTKSNLVYADGHIEELDEDFTGNKPFPFRWY